ncbi:MAG TPA: hypothetical protein VKD47_08885 [Miltoncostaeaceae bacterium]|nr:hypothetical protein [Miltoncostaeaceae bacterium]
MDVGSNSTRLFLCSGVGPAGPEGERETTITALRRGAGPDGSVTAEALERLEACLAGYRERIERFGADDVEAVGTSAVRDAPNRDAVEAVVRRRLDAPLRVLAGGEEAALSFAGARLAAPGSDDTMLVMDIGGGSTELVRGGGAIEGAVSLDVGAVRFTERFLHSDPPSADETRALRDEVVAQAGPAIASIGGTAPMIGVAGTVTSLAAILLGAYDPERVHRMRLAREDVEGITARLAAVPIERRREVPGLDPARAPAIVAGGLIAAGVMEAAGAADLLVSERDLLDGIALERGPGDAQARRRPSASG